jgi:hypothetical protein
MANSHVRITKIRTAEERELKAQSTNKVLESWLSLSIEDLEHRLRYSKEETQVLQGALRALDDLKEVLSKT